MKCESCGIYVSSKYAFAIKNNQCPACGKGILSPESMVAYHNLKDLLVRSKINRDDTDAIASLVVSNFELKQKFKIEFNKSEDAGYKDTGTVEVTEVDSEDDSPVDKVVLDEFEQLDDEAKAMLGVSNINEIGKNYKTKQLEESKKISERLKLLREEALNESISGQESDMFGEDESMHETVVKMKKAQTHERILAGSGGKNSFSRGG